MSLGVRYTAVVQDLQQHIEDVGMGLLYLVKEHHRIGLTPYGLGQLSALVIAHVSRRRSKEPRYRILLHVFAHIYTDHIVFIVKKRCRQGLGKLGLSDSRRSQEEEGAYGLRRVLDTGPRPYDGVRHPSYGIVLTDDPLMQLFIQMQGLLLFTLGKLRHGYSGPAGDDLCDLVLIHRLMHHRVIGIPDLLLLDLQMALELRQLHILHLGGLFIVAAVHRKLDLVIQSLDTLSYLRKLIDSGLFVLPLKHHIGELLLALGEPLLQILEPLLALIVLFFPKGHYLYFHLGILTPKLIELRRHRIKLHLNRSAGLVHEVYSLVGQETVAYISVGKHGCAH